MKDKNVRVSISKAYISVDADMGMLNKSSEIAKAVIAIMEKANEIRREMMNKESE